MTIHIIRLNRCMEFLRRMTRKTELASLRAAFPNHKVTLKYNEDTSKTITLTKKLRQRRLKNVKQN